MWTAPRALLATAATVKSSVGASAGQGRDGQWAQEHEAFHHEHIGLCQQTKPQHHAKVVGMPEKGLSYHRLHFEWSAHDPKPRSAFRCAETTCPYSGEGLGRSGCRADGVCIPNITPQLNAGDTLGTHLLNLPLALSGSHSLPGCRRAGKQWPHEEDC